ncbi:hypothetical protein [Candidatus Nitrosocosmicus sp. SS]|jgi:hypothetical protein|uniref:hypothetical protein n=1 Tax=Candidatus Nitrosocosmicus agrestis TaxID=2563600 RepID=UPI00122E3640|nr:hypothetical protein [Candidatus Nitrosocosmicus sp. SS]KAA2283580.1 hypothetical protein F1Z66_01520 [Candidatus Nitrosocosmicus sp. SS]KAF0869662.1 hypothetical protein E5N71_04050 [Candidatus Nitrosocosmicus sp. SS]
MSKKRQVIIISIVVVVVTSIIIYIEFMMKPQNLGMNSEKVSPFAVYFHSNLSISIEGKPIKIPSQIGIDYKLWNDHSLDKFGFPGMPMDEEGKTTMPGMAPLYTTNDKGRITVGSITERDYTLGDFLRIWGELDTDDKVVNATVNGKAVTNYTNVKLEEGQQIKLYIQNKK